ncbi:MAG TPA: hypothetical protein VHT52_16210 [Stellaceae bacterium]|jgi:hypothetical protein|nr:hypothetical protein [Stellaceae bacterium]
MSLHPNAFQYLKPTEKQMFVMSDVRDAFTKMADVLQRSLPDGADKTYVLRKLRECAMWANISITREQDGSPRE